MKKLSEIIESQSTDKTFAVKSPYTEWVIAKVSFSLFKYALKNYYELHWSNEWETTAFDNEGPIWRLDERFEGKPIKKP